MKKALILKAFSAIIDIELFKTIEKRGGTKQVLVIIMGRFKDYFLNFMKRLVGDTDVIENNESAIAMLNFGGKKIISRADAVELGTALKRADMDANELSDRSEASIILDGVRAPSSFGKKEKTIAPRENKGEDNTPKTRDDEERIH